ncbi:MAG TPA: hypothetical protein VHG28_23085 [Longimicrobiaceae bacterium]|nr:hypothetical protein [Longimicrobiaceae bacterium]
MPTSTQSAAPPLREQLAREVASMVRHLITNGTRVPAQFVQSADQFETAIRQNQPVDVAALASTHERLSRLVAPAKPGTLALLDASDAAGRASSLGPVTLVRNMIKVAFLCVAAFIVLSVVAVIDAHPGITLLVDADTNTPPRGDNHTLLVVEIILERIFWLSAAGIGASFAMLFHLNDQIIARTYDPDEVASYWVKFFLGVVAGFILVALVPLDTTADTGAEALTPATIALLGGFSASAVYRILTRMVEALESVFSGGSREQVAAAEKAAVTRASEETTQARVALAGQLVEIQEGLAAGMTPQEMSARLRQMVAGLVPGSADTPAPRPHGPPAGKVSVPAVVAAPEEVPAQVTAAQPDAPVSAGDGESTSAAG